MRLFGSERFSGMIERLGLEEDTPIEAKMLTKQIENAQKKIEGKNFDIRRHVLEYDDVMNKQREVIYQQRRQVLEGANMHEQIMGMVKTLIENAIALHSAQGTSSAEWDMEGLASYLQRYCIPADFFVNEAGKYQTREALQQALIDTAQRIYQGREEAFTEMGIDMRELERVVLLSAVDRRWMDHIDAMDHLRDGIGLRAYGQKNPIVEYKIEGFEMFEEMVRLIQEDTISNLYNGQLRKAPERQKVAKPEQAKLAGDTTPAKPKTAAAKVGRNAPCPCGSGKKYKQCCGKES